MSSLHVKHRPNSLDTVWGQEKAIKSLKKVLKGERAHSFIFTGPSGCGKTTLARILANEFAGQDATVVNVEEVDAATKSGADDMREVIRRTAYRAIGKSPVKAVIVDECHRLSSAAWTVLLKPIEEPPQHVYWMFCSTEPAKIPKTIQTRCLRYDLQPLAEEDLLGLIVHVVDAEKLDVSEEIIEAIAENCEGSPRQALVFLESCQFCESANEARQLMRSAGQTKGVIDLARWLVGGRTQTWAEATKLVKGLEGTDAESARIVLVAYLTSVLLGTKDNRKAAGLLGILECFSKPYLQTDKMAPLLMSIGLAINLDR